MKCGGEYYFGDEANERLWALEEALRELALQCWAQGGDECHRCVASDYCVPLETEPEDEGEIVWPEVRR